MASKTLPANFPALIHRAFETFEGAYDLIRRIIDNLSRFRRQVTTVVNDHATRLDPSTGIVAPTSTPTDVNLYYLDTAAKDMYVSVGTGSSADWKKITP